MTEPKPTLASRAAWLPLAAAIAFIFAALLSPSIAAAYNGLPDDLSGYRWTGTVETKYEELHENPSEPGRFWTRKGAFQYDALTYLSDNDQGQSQIYGADVAGSEVLKYFDCYGVGKETTGGLNGGTYIGSETNYRDALNIGSGPGGIYIQPYLLYVWAKNVSFEPCGSFEPPPPYEATTSVGGPGSGWAEARLILANDSDPDPAHHVGSMTWTEANMPPGMASPEQGNYKFTIFYDLRLDFVGEPECNDGVSNDFDGIADYPLDPGCTDPSDPSELGTAECDNGRDDNGDGRTDWPADTGCSSATGAREISPPPVAQISLIRSKTALNRVTFSASESTAAPGSQFFWQFGDGTTAQGTTVTHDYPKSGPFRATLSIVQPDGQSASASTDLLVRSWVIAATVCGTVKSGTLKGRERCYFNLSNEYAAALKKGEKVLLPAGEILLPVLLDRYLGTALWSATKKVAQETATWMVTKFIGKRIVGDFYKLSPALMAGRWAGALIEGSSIARLYNEIGDPKAANRWCLNTEVTYMDKKMPRLRIQWPFTFVRNYKPGASRLDFDAYVADWQAKNDLHKLPVYCTGQRGMVWTLKSTRDAGRLLAEPRVNVLYAGDWAGPRNHVLE